MLKRVGLAFLFFCCVLRAELEMSPSAPAEVPTPAVNASEAPSANSEAAQESVVIVTPTDTDWRYGFEIQGMGAMSKVSYAEGLSHGYGYGLSLQIERKMGIQRRVLLRMGYEQISVARFIDGSGSILDNSPEFTQTQSGLFLSALGGMQVWETDQDATEQYQVWIDVGGEYFHSLRAEQTSSFQTSYSFDPSKFVFFVAGPSVVWKIRNGWNLMASAHAFINVVGTNRFEMGGGKLSIALSTPL